MPSSVSNSRLVGSFNFDLIKDSMLPSDERPLAEVLDSDQWQSVFDEHGVSFGTDEDSISTPAITLWTLISQAFFKEEMRSWDSVWNWAYITKKNSHARKMDMAA